jgi:hypothetical protein
MLQTLGKITESREIKVYDMKADSFTAGKMWIVFWVATPCEDGGD